VIKKTRLRTSQIDFLLITRGRFVRRGPFVIAPVVGIEETNVRLLDIQPGVMIDEPVLVQSGAF
jgi:hypothetical protein